jgi:hypothetical protein
MKKTQSKAESAATFGKSKEQVESEKEKPYTYVEKVYTYKDGSCRVIAPKYQDFSHD